MYTRREWVGNLEVDSRGGLCFDIRDSQSQQVQNRGKHVHEHIPQTSFLGNRHEQRRKEPHKQNEHQKLETFTTVERADRRIEDTLGKLARSNREDSNKSMKHVDSSCKPKKDKNPTRRVEDTKKQ